LLPIDKTVRVLDLSLQFCGIQLKTQTDPDSIEGASLRQAQFPHSATLARSYVRFQFLNIAVRNRILTFC